jgi:hypothetical protein
MKRKCSYWASAFALVASAAVAQLPSPTPLPSPNPPLSVAVGALVRLIVQLSPTQAVVTSTNSGIFPLVGVQPDQTVQVTVQYPPNQALQTVQATPLDGGTIAFPPGGTTISADGTITFAFTATHDPGLNQISLQQGSVELGVEFWVFDNSDPDNNPPTAQPITTGGQPL